MHCIWAQQLMKAGEMNFIMAVDSNRSGADRTHTAVLRKCCAYVSVTLYGSVISNLPL